MSLKIAKGSAGFGGYAGWYVACPDCGVEQECEDKAEALDLAADFDRCVACQREWVEQPEPTSYEGDALELERAFAIADRELRRELESIDDAKLRAECLAAFDRTRSVREWVRRRREGEEA